MEDKTCFVISPIGDSGSQVRTWSDNVLDYLIKPIANEAGYKVIRSDQITAPGLITSQILNYIIGAELVIADLTFTNPNVMYELGIRHSTGKPFIHILGKENFIPFDVHSIRTIFFDISDLSSVDKARQELLSQIKAIESEWSESQSPVSMAVNVRNLLKAASPRPTEQDLPTTIFANALKEVEDRLKSLEYMISRNIKKADFIEEYSRRIFIVHGHDGELKNELARLLEHLDFEPIILHEQPDKGQTIFEKLNGELSDVGFAFVILTPDDVGSIVSKPNDLKHRARQNVIFEHGLFSGHLKPKRVCALRRGDVETPSDLHGVLYKTIPVDGSIRSVALEIAHELKAAGYIVDANKLFTV